MAVNLEAQYQLEIEDPGVAYQQSQGLVRALGLLQGLGQLPAAAAILGVEVPSLCPGH